MVTGRLRLLSVAVMVSTVVAATVAGSVASADNDRGRSSARAHLTGYQEDPLVLSTTGNGQFRAQINEDASEITWELSYSGLGTVLQAHIHFGGRAQSGGISVFLCSDTLAGQQLCPDGEAKLTGTIVPASILGPANQGIAAGEFAELLAAIRAGVTYANVHTQAFPGGEIRGQLGHRH